MKIAVRSQDPFNIDRCWLVSIMLIVHIKINMELCAIYHSANVNILNRYLVRRDELDAARGAKEV